MIDRIEKSIELNAPIDRVWRALTDSAEFGTWFRAAIDGPFVPGRESTGQMTYPGFEHMPWQARVEAMEEPTYFAFAWPPYYDGMDADTSADPWTLVEFRLEPTAGGTRLDVTESGFDRLPADRAPLALRGNDKGWDEQLGNIRRHVES